VSESSSTDTPALETAGTEVLIAGAGPVGLVLAIELARRGVAVRIVDTLQAPTTESRAIVVHSRSLDHVEILGGLDELMERSLIARGMQMHDGDTTVATVSFESISAVHPYSAALAQTDTEAVLTARLTALGVEIERGSTLNGFTQDADGVTAQIAGSASGTLPGTLTTVRARYLVGTDGARSAVRRQMGQRLEGSFVGEDFLLGDVEGDHDYDRSEFHTFFSPGSGTGLLFALKGDRVRVFAQLEPGTDADRPVTIEWLQQALDERGIRLRIRSAHWLTRIELKHGQVPQYRSGRVFLAGDAAHIHSPAGGLGMNTGIQDAMNLGWKLAQAVQTRRAHADPNGTAALLDSYHSERHPVAAGVIAFSTRLSRVGTLKNPVAQHARNVLLHLGLNMPGVAERMAATVEQQNVDYRRSPIVSGSGTSAGSLKPGDYLFLPQTVVAAALGEAPTHLAIVLGQPERASAVLPDWLRELAITAEEAEGLRRSTGLRDGGVVIVRPDGYIGHIGASVDEGIEAYAPLIGIAAAAASASA
jgi:2-polyprenyl-6-methoxyphenol hydroxylase-like FAD-dependent oxidoreductase